MLLPVFERRKGLRGRLSIQTNPQWYRDSDRLLKQALYFHGLAPNMQVKLPVTKAGIKAIEEATYQGVNINATVSFTVPQSITVAEAVERGLNRREKEGKPVADMTPVCTIMIGRLDDWMQLLFNGSDIEVKERMQNPVDKEIVDTLYEKFPDFRKAYDVDGMTVDEFDGYGATVRTLRAFIGSYHDFVALIRDVMIPNPDVK